MDRFEEAVLAFVGSREVNGSPMKVSENIDNPRVVRLMTAGLIEAVDGNLQVTIEGWRYLDSRGARARREKRDGTDS